MVYPMSVTYLATIAVFTLTCVFYSDRLANAGWFGPNDYHECLIDKMKGQNVFMLRMVETECLTQFACNSKARTSFQTCLNNLQMLDQDTVNVCSTLAAAYCNE
jgi:hypothetical protein